MSDSTFGALDTAIIRYISRLSESEPEFAPIAELLLEQLPTERRRQKQKYEGPNRRQVFDLRYYLARFIPADTPEL